MLTSLLLYLAEASFCLCVFALAYRLRLASLTYFAANRAYLLGALALSVVIPLRSGEDFSRAKLMETQRILARQGQVDPNKVGINPAPEMRSNQATDLVNIGLVVEKANQSRLRK